jgi:hypothetical protein
LNNFFENQASQGLKRTVCVRKRFVLSFFTKLRSFQALEPAAILFLMLLQAILCWGSTEIKDDQRQKVVTLSFRVLEDHCLHWTKHSAIIFHKVGLLLVFLNCLQAMNELLVVCHGSFADSSL